MVCGCAVLLFAAIAVLEVTTTVRAHYTPQWVVHVPGGHRLAQQVAKDHGFVNLGEIFEGYYHFSHSGIAKRSLEAHEGKRMQLAADTRVQWSQQQKAKRRVKRDFKLNYSDPRWGAMWYLNRGNGLDMNVIPAWNEGITGKGAVVTILDDGLEKDHPDLLQNYDALASYDVNNQDSDPSPRYDMIDSNRHGTRCAGEVAATSNNSICSLGLAYGAQVGGVRMLDGDVTDAVEARSLSLNPHHIDIYSASWGPDDDGKTVDGPGELATRAFFEGVTKGRSGKGSIFVWASGNGGRDHDNCNCDGYTNSIYSLSISSATEHGRVPWYSEACSSTLATTYSSGEVGEKQVVTTDLHHACTSSHTGTSASAPLAAAICALALEANPSLTWRDMQHIVVRTARPDHLISQDWQTNGVGRNVSHSFGYGLMDAHAMVLLARRWITVPEQRKCEVSAPHADKKIPARSVVILPLKVDRCEGVNILEHVQAKLTISTQKRGDLNIQLISPMGTRVTLLAHRIHDLSRGGFNNWPFMSVHSWGETPFGTWSLEIHNDARLLGRATLQSWSLVLYGTNQTNPNDIEAKSSSKQKANGGGAKKKSKKQKTKPKSDKSRAKTKNSSSSKSKIEYLPFYYAVNASVAKLSKFPKNYSITYPIMIPEREFEKSAADDFRKTMLKQKEKSRDLNSNRNSELFTPRATMMATTMAAKRMKAENRETSAASSLRRTFAKDKSAHVTAWDLILYGTESAPLNEKSMHPDFDSSDDINNDIEHHDSVKMSQNEVRHDAEQTEDFAPSLSGCKTSQNGVCLECDEDRFYFQGTCIAQCPSSFFPVKYTPNGDENRYESMVVCDPCHYSCRTCAGNTDYACTSCFPDAFLHQRADNETYCYPNSVRTALLEQKWCFWMFTLHAIILSIIALMLCGYLLRRWRTKRKESGKHFLHLDSFAHIRDMERNVKNTIYSDSD